MICSSTVFIIYTLDLFLLIFISTICFIKFSSFIVESMCVFYKMFIWHQIFNQNFEKLKSPVMSNTTFNFLVIPEVNYVYKLYRYTEAFNKIVWVLW
jgi:hypothetical protein